MLFWIGTAARWSLSFFLPSNVHLVLLWSVWKLWWVQLLHAVQGGFIVKCVLLFPDDYTSGKNHVTAIKVMMQQCNSNQSNEVNQFSYNKAICRFSQLMKRMDYLVFNGVEFWNEVLQDFISISLNHTFLIIGKSYQL